MLEHFHSIQRDSLFQFAILIELGILFFIQLEKLKGQMTTLCAVLVETAHNKNLHCCQCIHWECCKHLVYVSRFLHVRI